MTWWAKCLLRENKDLILVSRTHVKAECDGTHL